MIDKILKLSSELIEIPSVSKDTEQLHAVLAKAREYLSGFGVEEFQNDGIPSIFVANKKSDRYKVILNGHLDVVPALENQFKPYEKDGKLYGRGSYDMKAATAVEILVFAELAKELSYPIGLQLVTDEEVGGFACTKYQIKHGIRADFVIAGEPTDFGVNNKAKGIMWVKAMGVGVSAHGAYPWNGENAIWKVHKFLELLQNEFPIPDSEQWKTTVNLAKIETSNATYNKVPDDCVALVDIRFIPEDKERVVEILKKISDGLVTLEFVMNESSQFTDENNEYVQQLREFAKEVTGEESQVIVKHGGSDIRHFNEVGCDGVTFGPKGFGLHTDEEWVDIASLEQFYMILKKFLLSVE